MIKTSRPVERYMMTEDRHGIYDALKTRVTLYRLIGDDKLTTDEPTFNHIRYDSMRSQNVDLCLIDYRIRVLDNERPVGFYTTGGYIAWIE